MFEKEKTVEITKAKAPYAPDEQLGVYKLVRYSWYEKQGVVDRSTEIISAEMGIVKTSPQDFWAEALTVMVREHPEGLPWDINYVKTKMDADLGSILVKAAQELTEIPLKDQTSFLEPLDKIKDIPG